jgi:type I restriction enzyme M protein
MADNKREKERTELYRTIWALANDLRGSVDGWDFKQYVLGMLFYRYISENLTTYLNKNEWEVGDTKFNYANISDKEAEKLRAEMVNDKGFFILPSELFGTLSNKIDKADKEAKEKAAKEGREVEIADLDENLNEILQNNFKNIEKSAIGSASEENFKGLFDDIDVNSNKLGPTVIKRNKRLKKLMSVIASMKLGDYKENSIDAFGDTYEYLMGMYASNAGKSGGEFFTPQEVSELLTRIALVDKTEVNKVYDPAVGSGSLLLKFAKILGKENVRNGFFGQEINITTYNLCRINMFLHDIGYEKFSIEHGDTLIDPKHWDEEPFEAIVSNPPYSIKWEGDDNGTLINDPRFSPAGVLAPKSKADFAFIMHSLNWLATNGTAAIVCFPGIMYRGGAEQKIRKYLIDNNYIECIIQLPDNLFYGTSIATCIMVLKKSKIDNQTLFIDASNEYVKATNSNKLSTDDENNNIENILYAYKNRKTIQYFTQLVKKEDIEKADYNLSVSTYVENEDTREVIDITVLNAKIDRIVERENALRSEIDAIIAEIEGV